MQFYKLQGELISEPTEKNDKAEKDRRAQRELASKIALATEDFNNAIGERYCFISSIDEPTVTLGIISTQRINLVELAENFLKKTGLDVKLGSPAEITLSSFESLLGIADRNCYIDDDSEVLDAFGLYQLTGRNARGLAFGENLVNINTDKESLMRSASKYFMSSTLLPELERIYEGSKYVCVSGHPVHYIIETDDRDSRREVYKILLDALHDNLRLESSRYTFLDFRPGENYSHMGYESIYKISDGGAVVVRYLADDEDDDSPSPASEEETIENICEMAKRYRNKVLTVFCFPKECKALKARFYEKLGNMSFVEICEDLIDAEGARKILSSMAKENHIRIDKRLFASLTPDRSYISSELHSIFDEWYNNKLKSTVYPQYKDVAVANKDSLKAKPQGSAYDELMEMIGLSEAKQVIKKALNYYKMQMLYEESGIKRDNPAMHMIFSGNPGTAKTSVARLFSRIMRENRLLSRGQIVEVGRSDLVGKYVGWTAKIVKTKFKEARGGVLFIDEAYSLVDDRDGSFGDEAINTIVQEMENHRSDVVVIFAGYPDKMEDFLNKNPGLRSRIAFHVPFADYDSKELCSIANLMTKKNGMRIEDSAFEKLERAFDVAKAEPDFGNGRYVRNILEQAKMNQASRLLEKDFDDITRDEIATITAEDIVIPASKKQTKPRIGFC